MRCLLIFILLISNAHAQPSEQSPGIAKWEGEVAQLEKRDQTETGIKDGIVFYGSSSIRLWKTMPADLAPWPVLNRGYGGASLPNINHYAPRLLGPHLGEKNPRRCKAIVVFVANDITGGNNAPTPETVLRRFKKLQTWIRSQDATIPFFWIEITPTNSRWKPWPAIEAVTKKISHDIAADPNTHLISTAGAFLGLDGKPRAELFIKDQLHLNADGYKQWAILIKAQLHAHLSPPLTPVSEKQAAIRKQAARKKLANTLQEKYNSTGSPSKKMPEHLALKIKGWNIHLHDQLWKAKPVETERMLLVLEEQLARVIKVVPPKSLQQIRTVPIWINPNYPGLNSGAEYHPGAAWLRDNGRDPIMVKAIEITKVENFPFENIRMPYVMLHELSHAYHDQILSFDQAEIIGAFEQAAASGGYDNVKRFNGRVMIMDKAYAMSNHKEYFAEITEAYFGRNDFFPFDHEELKKHDKRGFDAIEKAWGVK